MSPAILLVSSAVSACVPGTITGVSRPFTSTVGGRPGEKNRSLIFVEVRSIAVSSTGVDIGSAVGAGTAAFGSRAVAGEGIVTKTS